MLLTKAAIMKIGVTCWLAAVVSGAAWLVLADRMVQPGNVVELDRIRWFWL